MSSTLRGSVRKEYDFYATPPDVVKKLTENIDLSKWGCDVLEPNAGNGNICRVIKNKYPTKKLTSIEIRDCEFNSLNECSDEVIIGDYITLPITSKYDIIIGNPPFNIAKECILKSLSLLKDEGVLIFLLRTAFLESKVRYDFWQENPISNLYVLSKRPSFTGGKGTDSTSYSWFIWDKTSTKQEIRVI